MPSYGESHEWQAQYLSLSSACLGAVGTPKFPGSNEQKTQAVLLLGAACVRYFIGEMPGTGAPLGLVAYLFKNKQSQRGVGVDGGVGKPRRRPTIRACAVSGTSMGRREPTCSAVSPGTGSHYEEMYSPTRAGIEDNAGQRAHTCACLASCKASSNTLSWQD